MEKILNFFKKYKNILLPFLITILFFIGFFKVEYSRCTFRMYVNDSNVEFQHFLTLGRYILALWWKLVSVLKFSLTQTYISSYILSIVFMALSIYKIRAIAEELIGKTKDKETSFLVNIISVMIPLNPFVIELFLYLEKGIMVMSIFFAILAAEKIMNYFDCKKKIRILQAFIYILVSSFCYQGSTLIYLSIAFVLAIKYAKNIKEFIINNVIIAIPFVLGYGINFLCVKLFFTSSRISSKINLIENLKIILEKLPQMLIENFGTLPKFSVIISSLIIFAIIVLRILNSKKEDKIKNSKDIFAVIYILFATLAITIIPQFILEANSIQLLARSSISFGCIVGTLMLYTISEIKLDKIRLNVLLTLAIVMIGFEYIYMQQTIIDHYKSNEMDLTTAKMIEQKIEEYEKINNTKITKIVFYEDKNIDSAYPNIKSYSQINQKIISIAGRNLELIEFVSNRSYESSNDRNDEYEKYFKGNDWDYFDDNQLIFNNNALHLCIF